MKIIWVWLTKSNATIILEVKNPLGKHASERLGLNRYPNHTKWVDEWLYHYLPVYILDELDMFSTKGLLLPHTQYLMGFNSEKIRVG